MMTRRFPALAATVTMLGLLSGCASAPVNYYTLMAADYAAPMASSTPAFLFELPSVTIPAQVDQPQLVVRQNGAAMALVESERWIAPLADELRGAIANALVARHGAQDVGGVARLSGDVVRIQVDIQRFESHPGRAARIEAAWGLRAGRGAPAASISCRSRIDVAVAPGYDALVQGHQRAVAQLADAIAVTAKSFHGSSAPKCP